MDCPRCSSNNPDTQHFCGECGTRLGSAGDIGTNGEAATETLRFPGIAVAAGATFAGRYRIVEELGRGGMGRVFRAQDLKLGEEIALKFIRPEISLEGEAVGRFAKELKAARRIVHKNVARMFDLNEAEGVPFITMEYVRGENLKDLINKVGRLNAEQAVPIVRQVCDGLAEAHRLGVVHRDLKPQNIMVNEKGKASIMDFGIARFLKGDAITRHGDVLGTPAYLSPEQVDGIPADERSDLYTLGIILYEMVTGTLPFQGETPLSIAVKHKTAPPPDPRDVNPEVPEDLALVILRCMEKDSGKRFQSAEELSAELGRIERDFSTGVLDRIKARAKGRTGLRKIRFRPAVAVPALLLLIAAASYFVVKGLKDPGRFPWRSSIAVLPIEDLSPLKDRASLCEGLRSGIINKLNSIPELRVLPATSVTEYRDLSGLGADYYLQLDLQAAGETLRVTANLNDAKTRSVLKSFQIDRPQESLFEIQDEISRYLARVLRYHLVEDRLRSIKRTEPQNLEAYFCYLGGMKLLEEDYTAYYSPEDFEEALKMFNRALAIDPQYALAYWGLGNAYEARYYRRDGGQNPGDLELMIENYREAYKINDELAETNLGLGWAYFNRSDNEQAFLHFKRAVEFDPRNAMVNRDTGAFLRSLGLYKKAIKYLSRAYELDPSSAVPLVQIASCRLHLGEYGKSVRLLEGVIEKEPGDVLARIQYAIGLIMTDNPDGAEKELLKAREINPEEKRLLSAAALLDAVRGEEERALEFMNNNAALGYEGSLIYVFLGMKDAAIRNIEAGIELGRKEKGECLYSYPVLAGNKAFKPLRDEPRFREILREEKAKYREKLKTFGAL